MLSDLSPWLTGAEIDPGGGVSNYYVVFGARAVPTGATWLVWNHIAGLTGGDGVAYEIQLQTSSDGGVSWTTIYDSGNQGVPPIIADRQYKVHYQRTDAIPSGTTHIRIRAVNTPLGYGSISLTGTTASFDVISGSPAGTRLGGVFVDDNTLTSIAVNCDLGGVGPWGRGLNQLDLRDLSGSGERNTTGYIDTASGRTGHLGFQADGQIHGWLTYDDGHQVRETDNIGAGNPSVMPASDSFGRHPFGGYTDYRSTGVVYQSAVNQISIAGYTSDFSSGWSSRVVATGDLVSCCPIQDGNNDSPSIWRQTDGTLYVGAPGVGMPVGAFTTVNTWSPYPTGTIGRYRDTPNHYNHFVYVTWYSGRLTPWLFETGPSYWKVISLGNTPLLPGNRDVHITNAPPAIMIKAGDATNGWWILQLTNDQQQIWATPVTTTWQYLGQDYTFNPTYGTPVLWKQAPSGSYFGPMDANYLTTAPVNPGSGVFYVCGNSPRSRSPVCFDYFKVPYPGSLATRQRAQGQVVGQ